MKHVLTFEDADIKEMVRQYVEAKFPGFTAGAIHTKIVTRQRDDEAVIEVALVRPAQPKD